MKYIRFYLIHVLPHKREYKSPFQRIKFIKAMEYYYDKKLQFFQNKMHQLMTEENFFSNMNQKCLKQ